MNHPSQNGSGRCGLHRRDFLHIGGLAFTASVGSRCLVLANHVRPKRPRGELSRRPNMLPTPFASRRRGRAGGHTR